MKIPKEIQDFINQKIKIDNFCLPHFYPKTSSFKDIEYFQDGYKINGSTGEILTGTKEGDFLEEWFVICIAYQSDPFFINIKEEEQGFPIYFSWHGAGKWTPIKVADSILEFEKQLRLLKSANNIKSVLQEKFDLLNEFWKEVYNEEAETTPAEEIKIKTEQIKELEKQRDEIYSEIQKLNQNKEISRNEYHSVKRKFEKQISKFDIEIQVVKTKINKLSWD